MATGGCEEDIGSVAVEEAVGGNFAVSCDPCGRDGKSKYARSFCRTHKEYLCTECCQIHVKYVPGQHDITDSIDVARKNVKNDMKGLDRCEEHGRVYVKFCQGHCVLCCKECCHIKHSTCPDVRPITQISTSVGDSYQQFEPEARKYVAKVSAIMNDCDNQIKKLSKQELIKYIVKEIDDHKQNLIARLDKAKTTILNELDANIATDRNCIDKMRSTAESVKSLLENLIYVTERVGVSGTDVEKFILNSVWKHKQEHAIAQIRSLTDIDVRRILQWDSRLLQFLNSSDLPVTHQEIDVHKVRTFLSRTVQHA